ncbi:MAG TPA: hypothetical protein V6D35_10060 [Candidatus Sericytochromatia bacterium]
MLFPFFYDCRSFTKIVAQLKELGYSFVTIPQLLEMKEKEQSY